MRILYIEDNPANISLLQRIARMGGHDVLYYNDGEVALANFARDNPDLILVDLQLAGVLGGLDVVRKLRADGVKLPIVAVTAYAMVGDKERCLEAGCDGYLAKPLPVAELVEIVQKYQLGKAGEEKSEPAATTTAPAPESQKPKQEDATIPDRAQVMGETAPLPELSKETPAAVKPAETPVAPKPSETPATPKADAGAPSSASSGTPAAPKADTGTPSSVPSGTATAPKADTGTPSSVPSGSATAPKADTGTPSGASSGSATAPKADTGTPSGVSSGTAPAPKVDTGTPSSTSSGTPTAPKADTAPTPKIGTAPLGSAPAPTPKPETPAEKPADSATPKSGDNPPQTPSASSNGGDAVKVAVTPEKAENGKKE
ncbi:MAG TPA: response regulator [Oceanobacillus sp.]|nr:response regulator [Oceanobacillus sp.]